jgi:hypothetical protein
VSDFLQAESMTTFPDSDDMMARACSVLSCVFIERIEDGNC